jgi:hypothetical protein
VLDQQTDTAILSFQAAKGLTQTGELNRQTRRALAKSTAAGETVCGVAATPQQATPASPTPAQTTASPTLAPTTAAPTPKATVTHASGASCRINDVLEVLGPDEALRTFTCADFLDDRWAAGRLEKDGLRLGFFARAEGGTWVRVSTDEACGDYLDALPTELSQYCSNYAE